MRTALLKQYDNPYPVETGIFTLDKPNLSIEVTRLLFHCALPYIESFTIYGENACYEWQNEYEPPLLFRMSPVVPGKVRNTATEHAAPPNWNERLPESIRRYTTRFFYNNTEKHLTFELGGGHHGSHPQLVHEFIRSIIEERSPTIDVVKAANWTSVGICARQSAMLGGAAVNIPAWE